jgi:hypothetical protein
MRRAVARTTLALLASAIAVASASQKTDNARAGDGEVISMRGCVSGSLLKSVRADLGTAAGSFATGERYRMIGSKAIKAEIKKANKALVEVTGRVKPGPQAVVKGKKMGGTTVGIGVAQGSSSIDQQTTYTPTIEVEEIEIIAKDCEE